MIEENVVSAAGTAHRMNEPEIAAAIRDAGFVPMRRNMHYDILGEPMFRLRNVPRRLQLDVAKRDGAEMMPAELAAYAARSRAARRAREHGRVPSDARAVTDQA